MLYQSPLTLGCHTLKIGSVGTDIRELQEQLVKLGFGMVSCGIDGDYGADTEKGDEALPEINRSGNVQRLPRE